MDVQIIQITSWLLKKKKKHAQLGFGRLPRFLSHYAWQSLTLTAILYNNSHQFSFHKFHELKSLTLIINNSFVMACNCDELVGKTVKPK